MWPFDLRIKELLLSLKRMSKTTKKPYAVCGALAMSAHGFTRQTADVDIFVRDEDRLLWLRAAKKEGLLVDTSHAPSHYMIFSEEHRDLRVRIDMLVPMDAPEWEAARYSEKKTIGGVRDVRVAKIHFLAAGKFFSTRDKDHQDFWALYERGLFEPRVVYLLLKSFSIQSAREFARQVAARGEKL